MDKGFKPTGVTKMVDETVKVRKLMAVALIGATMISFAPLMYSLSGSGPLTGAFFRMLYAMPVLWILSKYGPRKTTEVVRRGGWPSLLVSF